MKKVGFAGLMVLLVTAGILVSVPNPVRAEGPEWSGGDGERVHCATPFLPRPTGEPEAIRSWLEATGRWRPSRTKGVTPPANPQVGDTWDWYIWDLGGMPVATLKPCTVRGMGPNVYVVVDDEEWGVSIDQTQVDRIVDHFENQSVGDFPAQGIWDLNTSHFGDPPNPLDGLDRIFLLYYRFNIAADGFFWYFDQYPDGSQPFASNEADVVYLATDSTDTPGSNYMLAVAAHEFQHMIQFNQDSNENSWVDEGFSELAMWLFGHPDTISSFNTNPDNCLTSFDGNWSDYIQVYLWTLYAYEQFGGQAMIWDLAHDPLNGMAGYLEALTTHGYTGTMEDVFSDWSAANYLDDETVPDGRFGYSGEDLPPFSAFRTHITYPESGSGSVQNWGTDYLRLTEFGGTPIFDFDGADVREFRLEAMAIDPVLPTLVTTIVPDGSSDAYFVWPEANGYNEVVISIANVYPTASASYTYQVDAISNLIFADGFESGDTLEWSYP